MKEFDEDPDENVEAPICQNYDYENLSDEELKAKYEEDTLQSEALKDAYSMYDEQIGQLSSEKSYYEDEDEWNSYMDEKIKAQNDVVTRQYEIKGEVNEIEREMDRRTDN